MHIEELYPVDEKSHSFLEHLEWADKLFYSQLKLFNIATFNNHSRTNICAGDYVRTSKERLLRSLSSRAMARMLEEPQPIMVVRSLVERTHNDGRVNKFGGLYLVMSIPGESREYHYGYVPFDLVDVASDPLGVAVAKIKEAKRVRL